LVFILLESYSDTQTHSHTNSLLTLTVTLCG